MRNRIAFLSYADLDLPSPDLRMHLPPPLIWELSSQDHQVLIAMLPQLCKTRAASLPPPLRAASYQNRSRWHSGRATTLRPATWFFGRAPAKRRHGTSPTTLPRQTVPPPSAGRPSPVGLGRCAIVCGTAAGETAATRCGRLGLLTMGFSCRCHTSLPLHDVAKGCPGTMLILAPAHRSRGRCTTGETFDFWPS